MPRLATKYMNAKVLIMEYSSDAPLVATIRGVFKECDKACYKLELDDGTFMDMAVDAVNWIAEYKKADVLQISKKKRHPKLVN